MENASKALLLAASVLIGILVLSVAVYIFLSFGASAKQIHSEIDTNRLNEFNTQFTAYELKEENTIYDIITVVNLAKDNNEYYGLKNKENNNLYISVILETSPVENSSKENLQQLIEKDMSEIDTNYKLPSYSCTVTINKVGRVSEVKFTKK